MFEKTVSIVIPVQANSKRFPKKYAAEICGRPMLYRVIDNCIKTGFQIHVATPDQEVINFVKAEKFYLDNLKVEWKNPPIGIQCIKTRSDNTTGNEAVAEAALEIESDVIINVQGDEPLIQPSWIKKVAYGLDAKHFVSNGFAPDVYYNATAGTIYMVMNKMGQLMYASREPIPVCIETSDICKQVCVYAFNKTALLELYGNINKGFCEKREDICILRAIEAGIPVRMIGLPNESHSVDYKEDIGIVEKIITDKMAKDITPEK